MHLVFTAVNLKEAQSSMCTKIILILYSWQMLRISHYLPVQCARDAESASFTVYFLEFSGWTPSLLVMVRIQRISRDSWELWANCVKSG